MNLCSQSTNELIDPHNAAILTAPSLKELQAILKQSNNSYPPLARPTGFFSSMLSTMASSRDSNRKKISSEVIGRQLPSRIPSRPHWPTASVCKQLSRNWKLL
ncbi:hypothetical protein AAEP93_010141 [Penicillium crustosum]